MEGKAFVDEAGARFDADDDEGFLGCFATGVTVYGEPDRADHRTITSRAELGALRAQLRRRYPDLSTAVIDVEEHGDAVVADVVVVLSGNGHAEGWRVSVAVLVADGLIADVRAFWQREQAVAAVVGL